MTGLPDAVGQSLWIEGGAVSLSIGSAPAGQNPAPAEDASTRLRFQEREDAIYKIVVSTSAPNAQFDLYVQARNVRGGGITQAEVALVDGMAPADLIRDIDVCDGDAPGGPPPGSGSPPGRGPPPDRGPPGGGPPFCRGDATLRYRAVAEARDGKGADTHQVRFTILAQ